jgi:uncharacterized protein
MTTSHTAVSDPGEVALTARDVDFDWQDAPLHWIPDHPIASHMISALNLGLPEGERFFIDIFTQALPYIRDTKLREQVLGFMGQEAIHAETHNKVLTEFFQSRGMNVRPYVEQLEWLLRVSLKPQSSDPQANKRILHDQLISIAVAEHWTAFLGDFALNNTWDEHNAHPGFVDLFRWHGAEEVEHREVAYNVARYFGMPYVRRVVMGSFSVVGLIGGLIYSTSVMTRMDPTMEYMNPLRVVWEARREQKAGLLPYWRMFAKGAWDLISPSYHPKHTGSTAQAVAYLAKSPGVRKGVAS